MNISFEQLKLEHEDSFLEIFNYYIEHSYAAYFEKPVNSGFLKLVLEKISYYPAYVIKDLKSEKIIGFCYLKAYHPSPLFKHTAEITYFINEQYIGKGIGKLALNKLIDSARSFGIRTILANISSINEISIKFHLKNGFTKCGQFRNVGIKNNTPFDLVWMQKDIY